MLKPKTHCQVWVKTNSQVDAGMGEIVSLLNAIPSLQTVQSCQGERSGGPAYVYFYLGTWSRISRFVFRDLAPLMAVAGEDVTVSVEVFGGGAPLGAIRFAAEATVFVASALRTYVYERP
jgi:hypothetical protein